MKTHIARSVFETQAQLESALSADQQMRDQGSPWLSAHFLVKLQTCLEVLRARNGEQGLARNQLEIIQIQRRKEIGELSRQVRDFFQVLRRRNQREGLGEELEALHKRPKRMPQWATPAQWLQWAKDIVSGEEQALQQGYPKMVNPSAEDLNSVLLRAKACEAQWAERMQVFKASEQALRQAREQATRVLRGLATRLRETLAHEAPAMRRELMRTYGFSFISTGAKDRTKGDPERSQLANLIPARTTAPTPMPEDADQEPTLKAQPPQPEAPQPQQTAEKATLPEPPQLQQTPDPAAAEPVQLEPTPDPAPLKAATTPQTEPLENARNHQLEAQNDSKDHQLKLAEDKQTQDMPPKKLSRRQKKALRRAQQKPNPLGTFSSKSRGQSLMAASPGTIY